MELINQYLVFIDSEWDWWRRAHYLDTRSSFSGESRSDKSKHNQENEAHAGSSGEWTIPFLVQHTESGTNIIDQYSHRVGISILPSKQPPSRFLRRYSSGISSLDASR